MSQAATLPLARTTTLASARAARVPWYIWTFTLAVVSAAIGGLWDISWHISIGRDTFWSPPHMAIYLCAVLAGFSSAWLILHTTFSPAAALAPASVRMWGFRAPLGAFLAAWGGVAMLASAPFDDWWHNAYGLDVKVLSPPHVVLILGIITIKIGAFLLIQGELNRAPERLHRQLSFFLLFAGTLIARDFIGVFIEHTGRTMMHSARFYLVMSVFAPLGFLAVARATGRRWAITQMALLITVIQLAFLWILPLFPAEPKLGPVFQKVTHFIPPSGFPMLILAPAIALDLVRARTARWNPWAQAALFAAVYLAAFAAVQWPFASFLMTEGARNWFFGAHYLPFFVPPQSDLARNVFTVVEPSPTAFYSGIALALAIATLSFRAGHAASGWFARIKR
ncbi:MAG: hypothetical protein FJW40_13615 [Acidobacteria bacterium]|nr:hypothetical protein [Acidobacteriota bacterium]